MENLDLSVAAAEVSTLKERIIRIYERIDRAACQAGRKTSEITLELAVKTRSPKTIAAAGMALSELKLPLIFGHNHVQEMSATTAELRQSLPAFSMHLIGNLQSNKINAALADMDLLETLSSEKLADALLLRLRRDYPGRILPVFMEVNVSGEPNKHGIDPNLAYDFGQRLIEEPLFRLEGLMTVGALTEDKKEAGVGFAKLAELREKLQTSQLDDASLVVELSMGMSADLEIAIKEGSTLIRIGTDIFGRR